MMSDRFHRGVQNGTCQLPNWADEQGATDSVQLKSGAAAKDLRGTQDAV